jgi:putative MATE family efflux protein
MGAIAIVMYNICKGIMTALGDSKRPLYYLIFSSLLNVGLDLLFVAGFGWGVWSAALATTISQAISVIPCMIHLTRKGTVYQVKLKSLKISRDMFDDIIRYGLPSGVQNSVIALANVMVQSNINTFGEDAVAACGSYSKVEGFAFLPITCFSMALTTFVGQNLGAGRHDRAKKAAKFGIITSMLMAELIGLVIFFGAPLFIGAFNNSPEVVAIGVRQCHTQAFFFCLLAFSHCVAGICRGAGKAFVPMLIMLGVWCVYRIAYITLAMSIIHDIVLLFIAYPLTWAISSAIFLVYYKKTDWVYAFDKKTSAANAN